MRQLKITKQVTNRETLSLDKYLQEIGKVQLLTAEQEVQLARGIKAGNQKSLEQLTKANLRFVVSVAKQYQGQGLTLGDLINEGNLGLIKAAKRFDETRGFKFITYAVWWIRQSIMQGLAEKARIVRVPIQKIGILTKIQKIHSKFYQEFDREPSNEEIALELQLSVCEFDDTMRAIGKHVSLDASFLENEDFALIDTIGNPEEIHPESHLIVSDFRNVLKSHLKKLPPTEAEVVRLHFGLNGQPPLSFEQIGQWLELPGDRIREIRDNAIGRLKNNPSSKKLKEYYAV